MRIYLAGPEVFLPDPRRLAAEKKRLCAQHGFEGVFPLDAEIVFDAPHSPDTGWRIAAANEALIRSCDLLIANMTPFRGASMDVGTAYEMGYMRSLGRPVLGYSNVVEAFRERTVRLCGGHRDGDRWSDRDGLTIEDFGLADNLMLDGAIAASGFEVVTTAVAPDRLWEDLTGFEQCVVAAACRLLPRS